MNQTAEYYQGKVAVVTGGASGIGLALAETLLSYGAKQVALADFHDENLNRESARLSSLHPGRVLGIHCNVTKEEDVRRMIQKAAEFWRAHRYLVEQCGRWIQWAFRQPDK